MAPAEFGSSRAFGSILRGQRWTIAHRRRRLTGCRHATRAPPLPSLVSPNLLLQRLLLKGRLRQIQMVVAVARSGSMQQAARDLAVSQPAVTKAVSEIEADLGLTLFERHARGIRLTRAGKNVLPLIERILRATETFTQAVAAERNSGSSILRVGAVAAGINSFLAERVPGFCQANPDIMLKVDEIDGRHILSLVARDEYDVIVCRPPSVPTDGWSFVPVIEDEHAIIAGPAHPLAGRAVVTIDDLRRCRWLMPPAGVPAERLLQTLFEGNEPPQMVQLPTRSHTLNRATVLELGPVSVAPVSIFGAELKDRLLTRINFPLSSAMPPLGLLCPDQSTGNALDRFVAAMAPRRARVGSVAEP